MRTAPSRTLPLVLALVLVGPTPGQELPPSGTNGVDVVWASDPSGTSSQLYLVDLRLGYVALPVDVPVASVPSRWAHRRRNLGALETAMTVAQGPVLFTPMGDGPGTGGIHMVDGRAGVSFLLEVTGGNPAGYALAVEEALHYVISAEDDGTGHTLLRGYSYQTPGVLVPLVPPILRLAGSPAAAVERMGVDDSDHTLHVPTVDGVHVVTLAGAVPQMTATAFVDMGNHVPTTNPVRFGRDGSSTWIVGSSAFSGTEPTSAGWRCWTADGTSEGDAYGVVPGTPGKRWVPAAGAHELAVVGNGTETYVYNLLREPAPGTFFIKAAAVGVTSFRGTASATTTTLACPDTCGEPFAIPSAHGTRVAFESSFGPPFVLDPTDGGEKINLIYSPLDPLGASTAAGLLVSPGPLGGRISTKGMDRPIWSHDGSRVFASTSWFPGAPQVALSGLEVLDVPADVPLNGFVSPHASVTAPSYPDQSILLAGIFAPATPLPELAGLTFYGNVFDDGLASLAATPYGELGQKQIGGVPLGLDPDVPDFPAIHPPSFEDAGGSLVPVPAMFGARRVTFDHYPGFGLEGLIMVAAMDDALLVQATGLNSYAALGVGLPVPTIVLPLPANWTTTSEFVSL